MQQEAISAAQKKKIAAIEKDNKLSDKDRFKAIDAVMNEAEGKMCEKCNKVHEGSCMGEDNTNDKPKAVTKEEVELDEAMQHKDAKEAAVKFAKMDRNFKVTSFGKEHFVHHKEDEEGEEAVQFFAKGGKIHVEYEYGHTAGGTNKVASVADAISYAAKITGLKEEIEEAQMYVVRYSGKDKTSDSSPMSKSAADARAKRGNSVDKVGGKYTVVSVNSKGNEMKEFHAPGMAPKPKKKASPSSTKKSLGDISKRANEEVSEAAVVDTQMSHSVSLLDTVNAILMGKRDEMEESKSAALSKKLAKASASSEKGKKAVTLKKAPWEKKDEDASNDKSDDGEGMDKVDKKAVKKKFDDRKDKDIDNDGDIDSSDKYLHKKRQAVSKAIDKDEPKKKAPQKKTGTQEPVDVDPTLDEEALQQKINAILEKLKEKKSVFEKKYGSRCEKVMYATAKKMAMK